MTTKELIMIKTDSFYMERAIFLAKKGIKKARPNPSVGCVIVHEGEIIGEGHTEAFGGHHAEVVAIEQVHHNKMKTLLSSATLYVTLEPCTHFGKTPPCADLIIKHQLKKVVIACKDPNDRVCGKGIKKLKEAGIAVEVGLLATESAFLNRRFFVNQILKRPYIILKWAQTADGFVARENYDSKWISGKSSRLLVHQWRAEEAVILVGASTVQYDDPQLGVRDWHGENPIRVIMDPHHRIPEKRKVWDNSIETIRVLAFEDDEKKHSIITQLKKNLFELKVSKTNFLNDTLKHLFDRNLSSIFVEGGRVTLQQFLENELWDECRIFESETNFIAGIEAPKMNVLPNKTFQIGADKLNLYYKN